MAKTTQKHAKTTRPTKRTPRPRRRATSPPTAPNTPERAMLEALELGRAALRLPSVTERSRAALEATAAFLGALALVDRLPILSMRVDANADGDGVELVFGGGAALSWSDPEVDASTENLIADHARQRVPFRVSTSTSAVDVPLPCSTAADCEKAILEAKVDAAFRAARRWFDNDKIATVSIHVHDPQGNGDPVEAFGQHGDGGLTTGPSLSDADLAALVAPHRCGVVAAAEGVARG